MRRAKRATPTKAAQREEAGKDKIAELFEKYSSGTDSGIGPEGVEALCCDLGLDPADRKVLLLAWKMGAQRMGFFSCHEFERGFRSLKATSLDKLKKALPLVEEELKDPDIFQDFLEFAFKFCLTEPRQKIIDVDTAVQMLNLTLKGSPHLEPFLEFLQAQTDYKTINLDQWQGFGRFVHEVKPDCSNYDENQAWPLLMDNYVEWRRERNGS